MNPELIFQPMLALMVLTAIVWFVLYAKRIPAMRRAGKPAQTYTTPGPVVDLLPEEISYPANNFKNQEPGTNQEIQTFCTTRFNVTFPMFSKISVNGDDIHPLYALLTDKEANPEFGGPITWNFNKFLMGRDGSIIDRFSTRTEPESDEIKTAIESALHIS